MRMRWPLIIMCQCLFILQLGQVVPGNALVVDKSMPFTQLSHFGNNFLTRFLACHLKPSLRGSFNPFQGVSLDVDIRKVPVIQFKGADACIIIFMNILVLCTSILHRSC